MDSLLAILGGVGLGAILKSIVDYFLNKKSGGNKTQYAGNDSNLLIVFYVQIMPDDLVMQLHRF